MKLFPDPYDLALPYEYLGRFVDPDGNMIEETDYRDYDLFNSRWWYGGGLWHPPLW